MTGIHAYQQQSSSWYRIDMLLAAYDGTVERIERARELVGNGDMVAAAPLITRALRIVIEMYGGLDLRHGEIPENMQRLYVYVLHCISLGDSEHLQLALDVLQTIREGLRSIRDEAVELERQGELYPVDHNVHRLMAVG